MILSKRIFILLVLIIHSIISTAQNITLKGFVKDNQQNPLVNTNIIALSKSPNQKMSFAITDDRGRYFLKLIRGNTYYITISYLGFNSLKDTLKLNNNTTKNFTLKESINKLDEVVIELPVTVKRDTIIYNTEKFISGRERKLKNVLKALPGVEVDKSGEVIVNGKKVTKMLVDGKSFFGGNTKLAVDNIPADAVDKVEVLDNYNEVAFLKSITDSDEMAMNIRLKEDKKQFVFGDIETGKGNEFAEDDMNFYKASSNLFYYSPKVNLNFIGNLNNIAEETFSFENFLSFKGGVNAIFKDGFNFDRTEFLQFNTSSDLIESRQKFGALNITKATTSNTNFSTYFIISDRRTKNFLETSNNYIEFNEQKEERNGLNNLIGIGNLNFEFKPNDKEQLYLRTQIKRNSNTRNNEISSIVNFSENIINTQNVNKGWYIDSNIEWHKKKSEKHTLSAVTKYTFNKGKILNNWITNNPILQNLIPIVERDSIRLQQIKKTRKNNLYTVFKHFWVLNRNNHIYTTIGNNYLNETFINEDSQILDNDLGNNFPLRGFNNETSFKYNNLFTGLHYKFRTGIFTFKQGVNLHNYNWSILQESQKDKNKWIVLPDLLVNIEFNNSKKIQLNYNLKTNFSDASKLVNGFYLQSYNSIFKGNSNLENELFHFANIRYKRFSLYRGLTISLNLNYEKKIKGYRNLVNFDGINRFTTLQLISNADEKIVANTLIRKRIKKIRYKLSGKYSNSKFLQFIDNQGVENLRENYSLQIGIETLFDKFPNLDFSLSKSIGNYNSSNNTSKFITYEPEFNLDYNFCDVFNFSFDWRYSNYRSKGFNVKSEYNIADAFISYKDEDSPWSFSFSVNNLFNTRFKQSNNFSDYIISDTKSYIMPRRIMFSVGYNL